MVDANGSVVFSRHHKPKQKAAFDEIVERDPGDDDIGESENDGEKGINHPVRHPLGVIVLRHNELKI